MLGKTKLGLVLYHVVCVASSACKPKPPPNNNTSPVALCKLPVPHGAASSIGFDATTNCVPTSGQLRSFMLFVDFPDAEAPADESPKGLRDLLMPAAADWYTQASHGALSLEITADITQYYRMPAAASTYGWESLTTENHITYIQDALQVYMKNGARPPPSDIDLLYIVPTRSASSVINRSYALGVEVKTREGIHVARSGLTFGTDLFDSWGYKTLNHETGHSMCLPDYYPYGQGLTNEHYVGGWSAMGVIGGHAPDFFAWDKWRLGWVADQEVDCIAKHGTTEHILTPIEVAGGGKKAVIIATNKTSAVVAEVRVAKGLDANVCAPGVLLYTIDTTVESGDGPIRVLDANPATGGCGGINGELNDATLSLDGGKSWYDAPEWGIKVKLVSHKNDEYTIRVEYQG